MAEPHLSADLLEQYVIGALDPPSALDVEGHVARCEACAGRLRREAQLETALFETAQRSKATSGRAPAPRRWARPVAVASAFAALAAGAVLMLGRGAPPREGEPKVVRCDDPRSARECVARANFDGLMSLGPGAQLEVPRYDEQPSAKRGGP